MNVLLVPVDGSESSLNALRSALAMLNGSDGQLHVISVQPPIMSSNVKRFISSEIIDGYYAEEGEKALAGAHELLRNTDTAATISVQVGHVAETIVEYAKKHGCNHIVMGTRGMGRVKGLLLGSVTTKVLSLADVPVTLVK